MKKSKQYKGTPHPRARKPLECITNTDHRDVVCKKDVPAKQNPRQNAVSRLHEAHNSVARLLDKIDTMMIGIHKLNLEEKLEVEEIHNFTKAIRNVESTMQEWKDFFEQISSRPNSFNSGKNTQKKKTPKKKTPKKCPSTTPCLDVYYDDLIPIVQVDSLILDDGSLSDSPLVPATKDCKESRKAISFESPSEHSPISSRKVRFETDEPPCTMSPSRSGCIRRPSMNSSSSPAQFPASTRKVRFGSTSPDETPPCTMSPPRSVCIRRPSIGSSSSSASTPSLVRACLQENESPSLDISTPEPPPEIVSRYPKWFTDEKKEELDFGNGVTFRHERKEEAGYGPETNAFKQVCATPRFQISPPRTCKVMKTTKDGSGFDSLKSPGASLFSPFRTPGLVLRSPSLLESPVSDDGESVGEDTLCSRLQIC